MTWHPTTNLIQTEHMTPEQRATLEDWSHGWEYFSFGSWNDTTNPAWHRETVYRGKPALVVTSVWFNVHNYLMDGPYLSLIHI